MTIKEATKHYGVTERTIRTRLANGSLIGDKVSVPNTGGLMWTNIRSNIEKATNITNHNVATPLDKNKVIAELFLQDKITYKQLKEMLGMTQKVSENGLINADEHNWVFIGDLHEPFCDPRYFDFILNIVNKYKIDKVVFLGDIVDNHAFSYHEKDPNGFGAKQEYDLAVLGLEKWYKAFPKADVMVGNHDCYFAGTEILTENGWVDFRELDRCVKVATVNPTSKCLEYQMPTNYIKTYSDRAIRIETPYSCQVVTEGHDVVVKNNGTLTKVKAKDVTTSMLHSIPEVTEFEGSGQMYSVTIAKDLVGVKFTVESLAYDKNEEFYCVTVPNGIVVTRFNGKTCISGNCLHKRQAKTAGLLDEFLRPIEDILNVPNWKFHTEFETNKFVCGHGDDGKNLRTKILHWGKSYIQGHYHSDSNLFFTSENDFGMQVGCGVDKNSYAFKYAGKGAKRFIHSAGLYVDGNPMLLTMKK